MLADQISRPGVSAVDDALVGGIGDLERRYDRSGRRGLDLQSSASGLAHPVGELVEVLHESAGLRPARLHGQRTGRPRWLRICSNCREHHRAGDCDSQRYRHGLPPLQGMIYPRHRYSFSSMTEVPKPAERKKRTITEIRESKKSGEKMVYTSVLDYTSAKWAEAAGIDVCVVGDSLAMTCHGHPNTIPATMDMMVLHAAAVRRGAPNTFVLGCMPYQSYHTVERALTNATRFMQEAACDAVKPQGGKSQAHVLKALVEAGIPTASHIGLTPHTIAMFGGFKIQGRTADAAMKILEDALAIQDAGCFMLEFEAVPAAIAKVISQQLDIPTIGIGAGAGTDGQILLSYDLLGVFTDFKPKFTKRYANLTEVAVKGLAAYVEDVKRGSFPDDDHSYGVDDQEYEKFLGLVEKRKHV